MQHSEKGEENILKASDLKNKIGKVENQNKAQRL